MQSRLFRWTVVLALVLSSACGGGGGGGGGGDSAESSGSSEGAPVIRAWLAAFPTDFIPGPGLGSDGGSALLLVGVSDATPGSTGGTVVEANGQTLVYDSAASAWRGWLLLSTRQRLDLTVRRGTLRWSVGANLIDVYPQMVAPRQRDNFPTDFAVTPSAVLGQPVRLSWTGQLPTMDHQWAVMAMDGLGNLTWPAVNRFQLLSDPSANRYEMPPGVTGNYTTGFVGAGIARSTPIVGAGTGSMLTLAAFSMSELFIRNSDPGIARLALSPSWISVGVGKQQPLLALGYSNPTTTGPTDLQDATARVTWTTDDPSVATIDTDGVLRGLRAGSTTVRIATGGLSAAAVVRVIGRRVAATSSDVGTVRADTTYTGTFAAPAVSAISSFPVTPRWTAPIRGSVSAPLAGDGKVFVLALPWDSNGDSRLRLHAIDPVTGADAWAAPIVLTTFHRRGHMALEGRRLVVVTTDCDVSGIDTTSGARLWSVNLARTVPNVSSCDSPPTVRNGLVYVVGTGVAATPTALDLEDGRVVWTRRVSAGGLAPMTLTDDAAYLGSLLQGMKLDAQSGVVLWRHSGPGSGGGGSFPVLRDGKLYLDEPSSGESVVLDAGGGSMATTRFTSYLEPAVTSAFLYTTLPRGVIALRIDNGNVGWSITTPVALRSAPAVAGGALLLPLEDGWIEWRDAETGLLWSRTDAGPAGSTGGIQLTPGVAVWGGLLLVPLTDRLVAFDWPAR